MAKIKEDLEVKGLYYFECPGCERSHFINTNPLHGGVWEFNKNFNKPTASPSLLVRIPWEDKLVVCHSFVKDGNIQFLNDCTHKLAGQTVELPEL